MPTFQFTSGNSDTAILHHPLSSMWTGLVDVKIHWYQNTGGSGTVTWDISSECFAYGTGDIGTFTFNPSSTVTTTVNANKIITESAVTAINTTGCTPGGLLWVRIAYTGGTYSGVVLGTDAVLVTRHN